MSIARRSIESSSYTILSSGVQTGILFLRSILLARLLDPAVFGIYSFAFSFVLLTSPLPTFGMHTALIHHSEKSEGELPLRVHFSLSLLFNILWIMAVCVVGYILLPTENYWLIPILACSRGLINLSLTASASLTRQVLFRRIAALELIGILLASITAIVVAYQYQSVISLVLTDVIMAVVIFSGLYLVRPVWKIRLGWSKTIASYLIGFGKHGLASTLFSIGIDNVDDLWIGVYLGNISLGYYSRAHNFATFPRRIFSNPLNNVAAGTYAELKHDLPRLSQAFFRVNAFLVRIGFAAAGLLALIAPEFILILLGEKWLPMLQIFRWMLIYTMIDPIKVTIANLFTAIGFPEIVVKVRFIQLIVLIPLLYILGSIAGSSGIAISINLVLLVGIVIMLWQAQRFVHYSIKKLFFIPTIAMVFALAGGVLLLSILPQNINMWISLIAKSLLFGGIYISILLLLEKENLTTLLDMAKKWFYERTILERGSE